MKSLIPGIELESKPIVSSRNIVYRGRDAEQRALIVKILGQEYPTAHDIARFRREYEIVSKVKGPGVEKTLGLHPWGHTLAMVIEDSGPDLGSQFKHQPMELGEFFQVAIALVEALRSIHAVSVIHKDINPSNICWDRSKAELRVIDFGIANEAQMEGAQPESDFEGSLPYLAPEQSGRTNRKVDYRSDYYSMGITFYELLTGKQPFQAEDTLDWIHQHLTKEAIPVSQVRTEVPKAIADIVAKLMQKNPDDRYQGSFGLLHDLQFCRDAWQDPAALAAFAVGSRDINETFAFPAGLYGRDAEQQAIGEDAERMAAGAFQETFVLGFEGVGKTALVRTLQQSTLGMHAYFIEGRFEQEGRDIPFFAWRSALQGLAKSLLLESEEELQRLRKKFALALEGKAGSLLTLAPQLELVIGSQEKSEGLDGEVARNRCIYLLIQLFKVLARRDHPLVLFLDNLHWADNPSLELLKRLSRQSDIRHMLIVSALRTSDENKDPALTQWLDEIKDAPQVKNLQLEPLSLQAVSRFLADTLVSSEAAVGPLASLLLNKTNGNPYFMRSLLLHLHEDGIIAFDSEQGSWRWDVEAISRMEISDNVIDVILKKLARLPAEAQDILRRSACIGAKFQLPTLLAIKGDHSEDQVRHALQEGIREGFLRPGGAPDEYNFQHDRIQLAICEQLPDPRRLHLDIGRHLQKHTSVDESLADIVRHLNAGIDLMDQADEKFELARLNYAAGLKAMQATAYASAAEYLRLAQMLAGPQGWQTDYPLVYQIHLKFTESLYNTNKPQEADAIYRQALTEARTPEDQAGLHLLQAIQLNRMASLEEALATALKGLKTLGTPLSRNPNPLGIVAYFLRIQPYMKDDFFNNYQKRLGKVPETILLKMRIMRWLVVISYQMKLDNLMATCVELSTYYSCRYGFSRDSAGALVNYAVLTTSVFKQYHLGPKLCDLAVKLDEHFDCVEERPYLRFIAAAFTLSLNNPLDECAKAADDGEKWSQQIGDLTHYFYNRNTSRVVKNCLFELDPDLDFLEENRHASESSPYRIYFLFCMVPLCLIGDTEGKTSFDSKLIREKDLYELQASNPLALIFYHLFKNMLAVIFEDKALAYEHGIKALPVLKAIFGVTEQMQTPYHFLSFSQIYNTLPAQQKGRAMRLMRKMHRRIVHMAKKLPKNLDMVQWLMEAEFARLDRQREKAAELYDRAIAGAQNAGYTGMLALFNDITARFYLEADKPRIAGVYFREAYFHYDIWGAKAKLRDLEEKYQELLGDRGVKREAPRTHMTRTHMQTTNMNTTRAESQGSALDLMAIVKTSEILASEVVLDSLLTKLMRTAVQSTGAHNGVLVLKENGRFLVSAEQREGQESGLLEIPFEEFNRIPRPLIQFALRSNEPLVIDDLQSRPELRSDPYIVQHNPKAVLCIPIANRGQVAGVIYVEHMSLQGAFTVDRVQMLSVIASQAAIFISNARLYASLEEKVAQRTHELATKTRDIQTMLQNIKQGIFTVTPDHTIHAEYSAFLETIFSTQDLAGRDALELLFDKAGTSMDKYSQVESVVDFCLQGGSMLEFEANTHLLPKEITRSLDQQEQFLELDWQPIEDEDGHVSKIMIVVRDTTELRALRRQAEAQRRELNILSRFLKIGPQGAERFFNGSREKIEANIGILKAAAETSIDDLKLIFRNLHTLKGNARTLGFDEIAATIHEHEDVYTKTLSSGESKFSAAELIEGQHICREIVVFYESFYQRTFKDFTRSSNQASVDGISLEGMLESIRESLPSLAQELHKEAPTLAIEPCPARFLQRTADVMEEVMMHGIRNALDHGIEVPADRLAKGKDAHGCIAIHSQFNAQGDLEIRLFDDGQGINLAALEKKGRDLKILPGEADDQAIAQMVFVEGVSTKAGVTAISGRGIGMDAVRAAIESLGGTIAIEFRGPATPNRLRPFAFRMILPRACLVVGERQQSAA